MYWLIDWLIFPLSDRSAITLTFFSCRRACQRHLSYSAASTAFSFSHSRYARWISALLLGLFALMEQIRCTLFYSVQALLPSLLLAGSTSTTEYRQIWSLGLWRVETSSDAHCHEMCTVQECTAATVVWQFDHKLIIHSHVIINNPHHQWAAHGHSRVMRVHHQTDIYQCLLIALGWDCWMVLEEQTQCSQAQLQSRACWWLWYLILTFDLQS